MSLWMYRRVANRRATQTLAHIFLAMLAMNNDAIKWSHVELSRLLATKVALGSAPVFCNESHNPGFLTL